MPHMSALGLLCLSAFMSQEAGNLDQAIALNSAGKYSDALRELKSNRSRQEQNGKFWFLLGITEAKMGDPGEAIDPLLRAVALEPKNNDARLEAAATLLELSRFSEAEKQYRLLAVKLPNLPKVWQGLSLAETGLSQQALLELKKSAPKSAYLYKLAALAAGEPDQPCGDHSYACRFASGDIQTLGREVESLHTPEALYWTTRIYAQLARDSMETLAGLPPSPELHEVMARLYSQNGRRADAIAELREAVKLSPGDSVASSDLAEALWADRQYEESIGLLAPLIQSNPQRGYWQFEMGDALFNLGRADEAIIHLKEAVRFSADLLPAQAKLGEALLRMGDAGGALPHLERAQAIDRDGSIHFQLATAYRKLGNAAAAAKAMQRQKELANSAMGRQSKAPGTR